MRLHQLTASNFMPYRDPITVDFPTDDHRNVMIVFGDNMRGKTSLMNALRWGFYGRAVGRHSRPIALPDIVNKDGAKVDDWHIDVFLKFDANGHQYELRRTADRRPHVATPSRPEDFIVATHLSKDGIVIAGDQIEAEINQFAPEQVSRFFLFDGELLGEYEELLIEGSEQGRQIKEAIEEVLGVPALTNGRAELGAMLKAATKKQSQEVAHIVGLERSAENMTKLSSRLDSQEADLKKLQNKLAETRAERAALEDELEQAATVLALKATLDAARDAATGFDATLKKKRGDRHALLALAWRDMLDGKLEVKRTILRGRQKRLTESLRARLKLEEGIKDVKRLLETRECPTCQQPFPEKDRAALGAQLGKLEVELSNLEDAATDFQTISSDLAIRQIEAKVVDRLVQQETWDDVLAAKLQVLLADREFPLPLIGAEALDPWFAGFATFPEATHYLITNMCNAAVHLVEIDGVEYLSFLSQEAWEETVQTARRLLASGVEHQWIEDNCQQYVKLLLPDNAREYAGLLWDKASKWCHFAEDSETRTLTSYGRGVDQVVEAVLLESAAPLHYSEITPLAVGRIGREIDERRVHNAAAEVGYLFGPGTYGVLKHLSTPRAEWEAIAEEAAEIVAESAADRQWHASELIDALKSRSISLPADFDKYQLDIALKEVGQLTSLGRMVWARSAAANDVARVDVRQAVLAILRDAGGPLASAELRQRLVAVRGINQGMACCRFDGHRDRLIHTTPASRSKSMGLL